MTGPALCPHCQQPASFVRPRFFESSISLVWCCRTPACQGFDHYFHTEHTIRITLDSIRKWAAGIAESQGTATEEEEAVAHAIRTATFRVEQARPRSERDLPNCSTPQAMAMADIQEAGCYVRHGVGKWFPPGAESLSEAARRHFAHTDRTVLSLVRAGWLQVASELHGHPVKVVPTFA